MQKTQYTWKEIAEDSLWITIAWEWLQKLLGRAVDAVLWVTMVFAGYQLIPGAPQPPTALSIFMFVAQFVALDIGGLGLNQLARQQGQSQWSYARVVAYCLIGITLITITYSGIEHAVPNLYSWITTWVEVILVVARSVMTVLYGQAIHSLKAVEHEEQNRVAELEKEVSTLREQLDSEQQTVSSLRVQLNNSVSSVQQQMDSEVSSLRVQLDSTIAELDRERNKVSSLTAQMDRKVSSAVAEVDTLRIQLSNKDYQLTSLKETMANGMKWHEDNAEALMSSVQSQLDSERERLSSLQKELDSAMAEVDRERKKVSSVQLQVSSVQLQMDREVSRLKAELDTLRVQLDSERGKVSSTKAEVDRAVSNFRVQLEAEQKKVSVLQRQLENEQQTVSTLHQQIQDREEKSRIIQLDTNRPRKNGQDDNAIGEQIRGLLRAEPGLSGRAIAARIGCSPTTASKWKELIEKEASDECANA